MTPGLFSRGLPYCYFLPYLSHIEVCLSVHSCFNVFIHINDIIVAITTIMVWCYHNFPIISFYFEFAVWTLGLSHNWKMRTTLRFTKIRLQFLVTQFDAELILDWINKKECTNFRFLVHWNAKCCYIIWNAVPAQVFWNETNCGLSYFFHPTVSWSAGLVC